MRVTEMCAQSVLRQSHGFGSTTFHIPQSALSNPLRLTLEQLSSNRNIANGLSDGVTVNRCSFADRK